MYRNVKQTVSIQKHTLAQCMHFKPEPTICRTHGVKANIPSHIVNRPVAGNSRAIGQRALNTRRFDFLSARDHKSESESIIVSTDKLAVVLNGEKPNRLATLFMRASTYHERESSFGCELIHQILLNRLAKQ